MDSKHKIIRDYEVTDASVHDSKVFEDILLDSSEIADVYADSAYRSKDTEETLKESNHRSHIHERAYRNRPLTDEQKSRNKERSRVRVRVEHVFGSQLQLARVAMIRSIGLARAKTQLGLRNLSYNLNRFGFLKSAEVRAS